MKRAPRSACRAGRASSTAMPGRILNNDGIFGGPGEIYGRAPGADFFGDRAPDPKTRTLSSDFAFENQGRVDTWGVNLRAKIDLSDDITLSSITDYKNFKKLLFIDVDVGTGQPAGQLRQCRCQQLHAGTAA